MFLKKIFRLVPQDPLAKGLHEFNQGRLPASIEAFEQLFSHENPEVQKKARVYACEAHLLIGDEAHQDLEAALTHYQAAADLQPEWADIHNKLGLTFLDLGQLSQAERCFGQALVINDRYFAAKLNLCETMVRGGNLQGAAEHISQLHDWCPPIYKDALAELAEDCRSHTDSDWRARFQTVRSLAPSNLDVARQKALGYIQNGEADRAIPILDELIEEHPNFPDLHHLLGLAYGDRGDDQAAIRCFEAALAINEHYLKARINLGITYMEMEDFDSAERELTQALETDPNNSLVNSALSEIRAARTAH